MIASGLEQYIVLQEKILIGRGREKKILQYIHIH
jgi:hypothetical protein